MNLTDHHSLDRLFHKRDLFRGHGLRSLLWGILAGILAIPIALCLLLLLELIQSRGTLVVDAETWPVVVEQFHLSQPTDVPAGKRVILRDSGMLATAWNSRDRITGRLVEDLYRSTILFDKNLSATLTLVLTLGVTLLLFLLCLELQQRNLYRTVRETQARARRMLHRQALRLGQSDLHGTINARAEQLFDEETSLLGDRLRGWLAIWTRVAPLTFGLVLAGLLTDWLLFLLCLLPLEAGWLIWKQNSRKTNQQRIEAEATAEKDLQLLKSGLGTSRLVRGFNMEEFERTEFQKLVDDYHKRQSAVMQSRRWTIRGIAIVGLVLVLGVTFTLTMKLLAADLTDYALSRGLVVLAIIGGISGLMRDLSLVPRWIAEARISAGKIFRFVDESPQVGQAVGAKFLPPVSRSLYFESVTYTPPGTQKPLLERLDLKLDVGEVVALISLDREVARSIAWLLPRFIEPQGGRILFDGEDIAWGTLESIRAETVLVTGNDPVLNGSVLDNLTGDSREYSLQDATDAAKLVRAHSFLSRLPQGYETQLGVYGAQLDAGQRFRLSLARAILRKPTLLIIEEPREQLDEDTKALLDDTYQRIFADRTVLILPSRLSTVKRADKVIVLHNGRVESIGTHASLIKNNEVLRHWEYTHFNPFQKNGRPPEKTES